MEIQENALKSVIGMALSNALILSDGHYSKSVQEDAAKEMKLKCVVELLDENQEDDFDILCHELKKIEEQGRYTIEAVENLCRNDKLRGAKLKVPKFILEFLMYHRPAREEKAEHLKLLQNVLEAKSFIGAKVSKEVVEFCKCCGQQSSIYLDNFVPREMLHNHVMRPTCLLEVSQSY